MKIVVCMKQTFDTEAKVTLNDKGFIDAAGVTLVVDPYSEFAVEEGIRIKENLGGEVIIVCFGDKEADTAIRQCLAMGADRAILVSGPREDLDSPASVNILTKILEGIEADIILGGFKSVDNGSGQVMIRIAEQMAIPHVNMVVKIELQQDKAVATREIDDGVEMVEVSLPAVFTAQQGLAEPRYPTMRGIMQAKKKEIKYLNSEEFGFTTETINNLTKLKVHGYTLPLARGGGRIIEGAASESIVDLVKALREEAKVL